MSQFGWWDRSGTAGSSHFAGLMVALEQRWTADLSKHFTVHFLKQKRKDELQTETVQNGCCDGDPKHEHLTKEISHSETCILPTKNQHDSILALWCTYFTDQSQQWWNESKEDTIKSHLSVQPQIEASALWELTSCICLKYCTVCAKYYLYIQ